MTTKDNNRRDRVNRQYLKENGWRYITRGPNAHGWALIYPCDHPTGADLGVVHTGLSLEDAVEIQESSEAAYANPC